MNCPHCGQAFEPVPDQKFCSQCGGALETGDRESTSPLKEGYTEDPASVSHTAQDATIAYCPWEDLESLGFFQALGVTVKQSLFRPVEFFSVLPKKGGLLNPLLYALIVQTIGNLGAYLSGMAVDSPFFAQPKLTAGTMAVMGILVPLMVLLMLFVWSVLLHVSLLLVSSTREDFETTFRVVSYSSAADLLNIVPLVGWLAAFVWKIYLLIRGIREVHHIGTGRSVAALAVPMVLCCGIIGISVVLVLFGIAGSVR